MGPSVISGIPFVVRIEWRDSINRPNLRTIARYWYNWNRPLTSAARRSLRSAWRTITDKPRTRQRLLNLVASYIILYFDLPGLIERREMSMAKRANDLRAMRLQKRLTQAEVAGRLKVSQSYYSSIEAGRKPGEIAPAEKVVNRMRLRTDRTEGGSHKAGRQK